VRAAIAQLLCRAIRAAREGDHRGAILAVALAAAIAAAVALASCRWSLSLRVPTPAGPCGLVDVEAETLDVTSASLGPARVEAEAAGRK
jgi:cobalamin biosynthesis protein CbiD